MPFNQPPGIMPPPSPGLPPRPPSYEMPGVPPPPSPGLPPRRPSYELPYVPPPPPPPAPPPASVNSNWQYGQELVGGQNQEYWEAHPDEYMAWMLRRLLPNATYAYKQWLLAQARRQYSLWNAYSQRYGNIEGYDERPLGDWLASFLKGRNMPWSETAVGDFSGGSAASQAQAFYREIARFLGGGGSKAAQDWRESVNANDYASQAYTALELMMAGTGYSPMVQASVLSGAPGLRQEYGGLGQGAGVPSTYAEWLWRMFPRRG